MVLDHKTITFCLMYTTLFKTYRLWLNAVDLWHCLNRKPCSINSRRRQHWSHLAGIRRWRAPAVKPICPSIGQTVARAISCIAIGQADPIERLYWPSFGMQRRGAHLVTLIDLISFRGEWPKPLSFYILSIPSSFVHIQNRSMNACFQQNVSGLKNCKRLLGFIRLRGVL